MTPTLPGTLPGLLQPGCPVVWLDCVHERNDPCTGWCVAAPRAARFDAGHCAAVFAGDDYVYFVAIDRLALALDLSRPEGVDRALRWLAGRLGLDCSLPPVLTPTGVSGWRMAAGYNRDVVGSWRFPVPDGITDPIEALRLACLAVGEVSGG